MIFSCGLQTELTGLYNLNWLTILNGPNKLLLLFIDMSYVSQIIVILFFAQQNV